MARPREFDLGKAREDAMHVFWDGGYKETSLPDLLDGLQLSRGSLYKAFGSKKNLFVEALTLYDETVLQPGVLALKDASTGDGVARISRFFSSAIVAVDEGDRRGCLLCNAAVGAAHNDPDIAEFVNRMLSDLTEGFCVALEDTKTHARSGRPFAKAAGITMSYVGLRVLARSGTEVSRLREALNATLEHL
ncbi:MAG: TetR/AcrR family transcriptional regulator [Pseudomonadota bacterium]